MPFCRFIHASEHGGHMCVCRNRVGRQDIAIYFLCGSHRKPTRQKDIRAFAVTTLFFGVSLAPKRSIIPYCYMDARVVPRFACTAGRLPHAVSNHNNRIDEAPRLPAFGLGCLKIARSFHRWCLVVAKHRRKIDNVLKVYAIARRWMRRQVCWVYLNICGLTPWRASLSDALPERFKHICLHFRRFKMKYCV